MEKLKFQSQNLLRPRFLTYIDSNLEVVVDVSTKMFERYGQSKNQLTKQPVIERRVIV
jgi:hypothetical protein